MQADYLAVVNRGNLIRWFAEDRVPHWHEQVKNGQRRRNFDVFERCYAMPMVMKQMLHLLLRAASGFISIESDLDLVDSLMSDMLELPDLKLGRFKPTHGSP